MPLRSGKAKALWHMWSGMQTSLHLQTPYIWCTRYASCPYVWMAHQLGRSSLSAWLDSPVNQLRIFQGWLEEVLLLLYPATGHLTLCLTRRRDSYLIIGLQSMHTRLYGSTIWCRNDMCNVCDVSSIDEVLWNKKVVRETERNMSGTKARMKSWKQRPCRWFLGPEMPFLGLGWSILTCLV